MQFKVLRLRFGPIVILLSMIYVVSRAQTEGEDCLSKMQQENIWENWEEHEKSIPAKDWVTLKGTGWGKYTYLGSGYVIEDRRCTYIGDFVDGAMTGDGHLLCKHEGKGYAGQFRDGKFHGCGALGTPASQYQGQFRNGVFHGYGDHTTFVSRFRGDFENGNRHGKGECIWAQDGPSGPCEYDNGKRVK
jgi:hypothetical protein